jgi:hypothetical protein
VATGWELIGASLIVCKNQILSVERVSNNL